jgi:hypothetical protein
MRGERQKIGSGVVGLDGWMGGWMDERAGKWRVGVWWLYMTAWACEKKRGGRQSAPSAILAVGKGRGRTCP